MTTPDHPDPPNSDVPSELDETIKSDIGAKPDEIEGQDSTSAKMSANVSGDESSRSKRHSKQDARPESGSSKTKIEPLSSSRLLRQETIRNADRHAEPRPTGETDRRSAETSGSTARKSGRGGAAFQSLASLPDRLGDYELMDEIDRGGMGVVFRAKQVSLNRIVALKVIIAGQFADDEDVQRFRSEAEAAANLRHPGIVPIYEVGEWNGHHYFSMAYIPGSTLACRIRSGPLRCDQSAQLLAQVSDAIECAHRQGIVHRDLKPSNILIDSGGHPLVTDFGLAKRTDSDSQLTGSGQLIGTPNYMSPEQAAAMGDEVGERSDIYSLGAILYCLITGRPPFHASNLMLTLRQVIGREPVPPRQLNIEVDRDLETICLKCMEKDPSARYASARALSDDLRLYLDRKRIIARPTSSLTKIARWRRRNPAVATLGMSLAISLLLLSIASWMLLLRQRQAQNQSDVKLATSKDQVVKLRDDAASFKALSGARLRDLVTLHSDRGDEFMRQSDPAAALPWYSAALALEASQKGREWGHRIRLTAIMRQSPRPTRIWDLGAETYSSTVSPDGELVAAAGRDGSVSVWNALSNSRVIEPIKTTSKTVRILTFSPDSRHLIIGVSKSLQILDLRNRETVYRNEDFGALVESVDFRGSVDRLLLGLRDGSVLSIDTRKGGKPHRITKHDASVRSLHVIPNSDRLFVAYSDNIAELFDLTSEQPIARFQHDGQITWSGHDLKGERVATVSEDGFARIWDSLTGEPVGEPIDHGARIRCASFDPTGSRIATGGWDATARIWDVETGKQLTPDIQHENSVPNLDFSPDGKFLVTASLDHTSRVWDTQTGQEACPAMHHGFLVQNARFFPDGKRLMTASADHMVRVWKLDPSVYAARFAEHSDVIRTIAIDGEGEKLLTVSYDGSGKLWSLQNGKSLGVTVYHDDRVVHGAFSHDGEKFVTCGEDSRAGIWSTQEGKREGGWLKHKRSVKWAEFSKDDRFVVTASEDKTAKVWRLKDGHCVWTLPHKGGVNKATYSADGLHILTCSDDGTARVWNAKTGQPASPWLEHGDKIEDCCFHPNGDLVATASNDHTAQVWNVARGRRVGDALRHDGGVHTVCFSPDGSRVLTGARDGKARLWDTLAGRPLTAPMTVSRGLVRARFGPRGRYIATACGLGAMLWDAEDGRLLMKATEHSNWVTDVVFSPDGSTAVSCGEDGLARRRIIPTPLSYGVEELEQIASLVSGHRTDPFDPIDRIRPLSPEEAIELLDLAPPFPLD